MVAERRLRRQGQRVIVERLGMQSIDLTSVNVRPYMYVCQVNALSCLKCLPRNHEAATRAGRATGSAPR
jgi:hypothetical protein